jgi:hypothetical protein
MHGRHRYATNNPLRPRAPCEATPWNRIQLHTFAKGANVWAPGLLIYVVMTARAAAGSTGALRRSMAAEMRVMIRPTGRGSMAV